MAGSLRNKILSWRSGRLVRKSYPLDTGLSLQQQTTRLRSRLYSSRISPRATINEGLPAFIDALLPQSLHLKKDKVDRVQMGLDLAIKAAERKIDPALMLQSGLLRAATGLGDSGFCAAIDFASRLIEKKIDPTQALDYALPAAAKNSTEPAEFQANLEALERLIVACDGTVQVHFLHELTALAELDPDLFRGVIEAGTCLAENNFNPAELFKSLQPIRSLSKARIWAGLNLAMQLAQQKMLLGETLQHAIPALAKAVSQSEFNASLECANRLVEKKIHPASMLLYGIPAASSARKSAAEFQVNLRSLEQFVVAVSELDSDKCRRVLMSLGQRGLSSEQFRISLECATRLAISEVDLGSFFEAGLKAGLAAATMPEEIRANFEAMERTALQLPTARRHRFTEILRTIPHVNLNSQQFCAGLETATRLEEQDVASSVLLKYGLPRVVRVSTTPEDFTTNLRTLEAFLVRIAKLRSITDDSFGEALHAALQGRSTAEVETNLEVFERLITRINEHRVSGDIAGGLAALVKQAIALRKCYEDFEVVLHHAITSNAEYTDPYYGTSSRTHIEYPQWFELIPSGRRLTPIGLALLDRGHIERLLESRSWAYRDEEIPRNRERAIERSVHWRSYLPVFMDQLMRQGILDPVTPVVSAYLIGSYPWIADPNDLDLFLVVEGERDARYFSAAELIHKGVALPEFFVHPTTQSLVQRNAHVPPLRIGISVEVIGYESLLRASRGEAVRHSAVLARRYCLLFGSVLLAGDDLFQSKVPPAELFRELHEDLLKDMKKANWPELAGDARRTAAKKAWRKREAKALSKLITDQFK